MIKSLLVAIAGLGLSTLASAATLVEGEHYTVLDEPVETQVADDRIEVTEAFWYGCPHCYNLEDPLNAWVAEQPEDVAFQRMPATMGGDWNQHALAFYAAKELDILDAVHAGDIKGMYILGENPAMSDPDVAHARDALAKLDHLVVQDIFITETANFADVILPASAFAEKTGTVTNTNRQVQMGRPAVSPPGEAREDWWIEVELAKRLGLGWTYQHPSEVFAEMKLNMKSFDNITWDRLETQNAVTYPSLSAEDPGQPIVFANGFPRKDGRAKFTPASIIAPDDTPDAEYPMILTTGRQLEHWHTGSMTRRSKVLDGLEPEANCSLHPSTLRKLGIEPGGHIRLTTKRGSIEIMARADRAVAPDMVFLPFAYVEAAANILTNPAVDPYGKIPEFKFSAVKAEAVDTQVAAE
jgi:formate dehydrogenase major subunit